MMHLNLKWNKRCLFLFMLLVLGVSLYASIGLTNTSIIPAISRLKNILPVLGYETKTTAVPVSRQRIMCWIPSIEKFIQDRITAVNETWVPRCDGHVFFINTAKKDIYGDIIPLKVKDGRDHLTEKSVAALEYLYQHDLDNFDWFVKCDDDSFIVVENLRLLLSQYNSNHPVYLGHLFKLFVKQGYMSGGASYVLSREALRKINEEGFQKKLCTLKSVMEDMEIGRCLQTVGVAAHNSIDKLGRAAFHPESANAHIGQPGGPAWTKHYDRFPSTGGRNCCSELTISFHHMKPKDIRTMDQLLYHTTVYGRETNLTKLRTLFEPRAISPP